ncbi:MAG: PAS domain S-box protein, partial [Candidatus Omnitrophota bacterium]
MSEIQGSLNSGEADMPLVSRLLYQMIDEKYSTLLDESSDFMCITDRDGKFIYVNKKLADSLGYTKKEMLGMYMWDIVAAESRAAFADKAKQFLKSGKTVIEGFVIKTKFNGKITGEMRSMAFYDNAGKYCGAKAVFKDSTKLLAIESLEKKYESMLEDGINTLDYIIVILDRDFRVKWASTSVAQYFGLDKTAIIGEDMREILKNKVKPLVQHDESFLKNIFSAYEANTCVESFECELMPLGGGENLFMEHWSYPVAQGDLKGGRIEIFRDITARKKSEETLEYYYKKIHAIMEHAVEGIVELKTDNTIQFVNKSFQAVLGYCDTEMLDRSLSDFILPDERMKLASVKLIRKAREVTFVKKDGTLLYTLISSIPLVFG